MAAQVTKSLLKRMKTKKKLEKLLQIHKPEIFINIRKTPIDIIPVCPLAYVHNRNTDVYKDNETFKKRNT